MRKALPAASLAAALFLLSCNNNKDAKPSAEAKTTQSETPSTAATPSGGSSGSIEATLTGGDMAGTYNATCKEACVSWGIAGDNVFGTQYSEKGKSDKELSSVQMMVNNVKQGNTTTNEFMVTVSFGELFGANSKSFNINTTDGKKDGSGTATINYSGDKATVTIKGTTKEGPAINLTIDASKVATTSNIGQ